MFVALSPVEPPIVDRDIVTYAERDKSWREERMRMVEDRIRDRLGELSPRLGDADWLDGAFSAADLVMVHVLQRLKGSGILDEFPNLSAYVARGEARPAFKRACDAQLAVFTGRAPSGPTAQSRGLRAEFDEALAAPRSGQRQQSVPHPLRGFSCPQLQHLGETFGGRLASLHGPLGLLTILLESRAHVLRVHLLHVAQGFAAHQLLRHGNILLDAPVHKLGPVLLRTCSTLKKFAVDVGQNS